MSQNTIGLNTLTQRVQALEATTGTPTTLAGALITATNSTTTKALNEIVEHFQNGVTASFPDTGFGYLSYLVEYTVQYVESNIGSLAQLLNTSVTSSLKLQIALTFLQNYYEGLDQAFMTNIINHFVDLLFNKSTTSTTKTAPVPISQPKSKLKFSSIRLKLPKMK